MTSEIITVTIPGLITQLAAIATAIDHLCLIVAMLSLVIAISAGTRK